MTKVAKVLSPGGSWTFGGKVWTWTIGTQVSIKSSPIRTSIINYGDSLNRSSNIQIPQKANTHIICDINLSISFNHRAMDDFFTPSLLCFFHLHWRVELIEKFAVLSSSDWFKICKVNLSRFQILWRMFESRFQWSISEELLYSWRYIKYVALLGFLVEIRIHLHFFHFAVHCFEILLSIIWVSLSYLSIDFNWLCAVWLLSNRYA